MKIPYVTILGLMITHTSSSDVTNESDKRPGLFRSASSSLRHYLALWPDDLLAILYKEYAATTGFHEGTYFGRSQLISNAIFDQTGKLRSASEVKKKLVSLGLENVQD